MNRRALFDFIILTGVTCGPVRPDVGPVFISGSATCKPFVTETELDCMEGLGAAFAEDAAGFGTEGA